MSDYVHPETLVDAEWVAQHRDDPNIRLIDVDEDGGDAGSERLLAGHGLGFDQFAARTLRILTTGVEETGDVELGRWVVGFGALPDEHHR